MTAPLHPTIEVQLTRAIRRWHTSRGDKLPLTSCRAIAVAAMTRPANEQRGDTAADVEQWRLQRFRAFGYSAAEATSLLACIDALQGRPRTNTASL